MFGGDSTALEIAEAARELGEEIENVLHVVPREEGVDGISRIPIDELAQYAAATANDSGYILSMADQDVRETCLKTAEDAGLNPATIIHPLTHVSKTAQLGEGVYVGSFSVISCSVVIEAHALINFQVTVGHHSHVGAHARLNPGARIGGRCHIGARATIGANAFVHQGRKVGEDAMVDALTYVDRDIDAAHIWSCRSLGKPPLRRPLIGGQGLNKED